MEAASPDYREALLTELAGRKDRNPRYSLRAFARDLDVSAAALSQAIGGKRDLSRKNLLKIAQGLALPPSQVNAFLAQAGWRASPRHETIEYQNVDDDLFAVIADWYYLAVLNLARLPKNRARPEWIAERLGISTVQARIAVARLQRLGLVAIRRGRLVRLAKPLTTPTDVPSSSRRRALGQLLELANQSLTDVTVTARDLSSVIVAVDTARLPKAKVEIAAFKRRLARLLQGKRPNRVYALSLQLFPLDRQETEHG